MPEQCFLCVITKPIKSSVHHFNSLKFKNVPFLLRREYWPFMCKSKRMIFPIQEIKGPGVIVLMQKLPEKKSTFH